jgi:hypothetical protein
MLILILPGVNKNKLKLNARLPFIRGIVAFISSPPSSKTPSLICVLWLLGNITDTDFLLNSCLFRLLKIFLPGIIGHKKAVSSGELIYLCE